MGVTGEGRRGTGRFGSVVTHEEPEDLSNTETRGVGGGGIEAFLGTGSGAALGNASKRGGHKPVAARRGSVDLGSLQRDTKRLDRV